MINEYIMNRESETMDLAFSLGEQAVPGQVYALIGDLGSGKTLFSKSFARGMGIEEELSSPTFTLLEEYDASIPLYHFDLYRIDNIDEFIMLDFEDYWNGDGVSLVEWADKADGLLPEKTIYVYFNYIDENTRRIKIEHPDN